MGIYIKGMEMPTSCPCELIGYGYDLECSFVGGVPARVKEYYECCERGTRPAWCPLVPVPEHGRLIDADALMSGVDDGDDVMFVWAIADAPTIIPAEEGDG